MLRGGAAVLLLAGGGVAGVAAVVLHARWWGLLLGLAAVVAALAALPGRWWGRLPFAVGWALAVAWLSRSRPEGDYLIAGDLSGYVLLLASFAVLLSGVLSLRPRRPQGGEDSLTARSTS